MYVVCYGVCSQIFRTICIRCVSYTGGTNSDRNNTAGFDLEYAVGGLARVAPIATRYTGGTNSDRNNTAGFDSEYAVSSLGWDASFALRGGFAPLLGGV